MSHWEWWAEYKCGCVSEVAAKRSDLTEYCPKHGEDARRFWRSGPNEIAQVPTNSEAVPHE